MIKKLQVIFISIAFVCTIIAGGGLYIMRDAGVALRIDRVERLDKLFRSKKIEFRSSDTKGNQVTFLDMMTNSGFSKETVKTVEDVIRLQNWTGNQVKHCKPYFGREKGYALLRLGKDGTGLSCGSMSEIVQEALVLLDIPARKVQLYRSDFSLQDTHVVVEAFINEKWVCFDPTFNVTYQDGNNLLGVAEIQDRLFKQGPISVTPVFHGIRKYPAILEDYYMDWRPLFSNAYVAPFGKVGIISKMPPFRYWSGLVCYAFGFNYILFAKMHNQLYFLLCVFLPVVALSSFISGFILILSQKKRQSCAE